MSLNRGIIKWRGGIAEQYLWYNRNCTEQTKSICVCKCIENSLEGYERQKNLGDNVRY